MLEKINNIDELKKLKYKEKAELAKDIREYILDIVSENGGHLASNLGVVELTIAIHSVFNLPEDKVVWDVGHQSYVHKILTGRKEKLKNIRKFGGIAGFPKTNECPTDCFNTGHSSTSISAALGMARARDLKGGNNSVMAVIGDGSLTGGMALEALNDAGFSQTKLTVILNDNEMSISKNIGGMNMLLTRLRTKKTYDKSSHVVKKVILKVPALGKGVIRLVRSVKRSMKQLIIPKMFFEDIGFRYLGPVDGHDTKELERMLEITKKLNGPILLHVITKKGKGYKIAEETPDKFHATGPFDLETGKGKAVKKADYSKIFGEQLVELAKENSNIVAITASMRDGTGLKEFAETYPNRFFDIGIAEQHAVCLAAGMAKEGMIPFVPIYSSFYQRAYDQVIHDIAIQNLPVVMCVDRAGIVGADGETHQGTLDLAFFRLVPNLTILAPKDFKELKEMMKFAVELKKPVVIRYPRGGEGKIEFKKCEKIELGKSEILKKGNEITLIAIGKMVDQAMGFAEKYEKENSKKDAVEVINARFLKPLDVETIKRSIEKTKNVITIEDGAMINGLGTAVKELVIDEKLQNVKIKTYAYPDKYIEHGSVDELEEKYNMIIKSEDILNEQK